MTEQIPPSWCEGGSHPSKNDRNLLAALVEREGIVASGDLAVTFPSANMNVAVAAGDLFMIGDAARQGMYHCWNDASITKTLVNGEANPRYDLIVAHLYDNFVDSLGFNKWAVEVVKGTASGSPVEPTPPSNSYQLARILVAAGTTNLQTGGTLLDRRTSCRAAGGVYWIPFSGTTDSTALLTVPMNLPFTPSAAWANCKTPSSGLVQATAAKVYQFLGGNAYIRFIRGGGGGDGHDGEGLVSTAVTGDLFCIK